MGNQVCMGAALQCSFGAAPSSLIVLPTNKVLAQNMPAANIMDNKPIVNVPPFGVCSSLANPTVASATSAALGVLTPMPCVPAIAAPWTPGNAQVLIANMPTVTDSSTLMCNWGGAIKINFAGQATVQA